jgi:hypothetical protein
MLASFLTGGKQAICLPAAAKEPPARGSWSALGITRPNGILLAADELIA